MEGKKGISPMKKNIILPAFLTIIFLLNSAVALCFPLKAKDDLGREIELIRAPKRIVSLAPTHTEILFSLGLADSIVGTTEHCNYPPQAKEKQKIGGFANPDIDKITALKPDLILAFGILQQRTVKELEKRGQKVFWLYPHSVKDVLNSFERIGEIAGARTAGKHLKESVTQRIKYIQKKLGDIPEDKRPTIFRVMGLDPLGTIGGKSFKTGVFYQAGGKNVFADVKKDYFQIDFNALIERDPDVIIVSGKEQDKARAKIPNQKEWNNLRAVRENRILFIPSDIICRSGPRIAESIERIASYLYPDRFCTYPQRIISLGPSITEELYLLRMQDKLIGCTTYCKRPKEAEAKEKVATAIEVNLEKVVMLKPDLVLTTSLTDIKAIEKLERLGIKAVNFPEAKNFNDICEQLLKLGKIVNREEEAVEIIGTVKDEINSIKSRVRNLKKPKVFIQVGAKPLFTMTGDSFINDLIEFAGGTNIAEDIKTGLYSREEVLRKNPDVIIIVTMGIVGKKEIENWKKYKALRAVKQNRIYVVDSYKLCSPTPVSFVETLEELVNILHFKSPQA